MFKLLERITAAWAVVGGVALLLVVAVTTGNAGLFTLDRLAKLLLDRNISGLPGYEDFVLLLIGGVALSFFPYCQLQGQHINVTLFSQRFPVSLNRALDRLWVIAALITAIFLAYWLLQGIWERRGDNSITRVLGWLEWPFMVPGIISLALWMAVCAVQLFSPTAFERLHHGGGEH